MSLTGITRRLRNVLNILILFLAFTMLPVILGAEGPKASQSSLIELPVSSFAFAIHIGQSSIRDVNVCPTVKICYFRPYLESRLSGLQ